MRKADGKGFSDHTIYYRKIPCKATDYISKVIVTLKTITGGYFDGKIKSNF